MPRRNPSKSTTLVSLPYIESPEDFESSEILAEMGRGPDGETLDEASVRLASLTGQNPRDIRIKALQKIALYVSQFSDAVETISWIPSVDQRLAIWCALQVVRLHMSKVRYVDRKKKIDKTVFESAKKVVGLVEKWLVTGKEYILEDAKKLLYISQDNTDGDLLVFAETAGYLGYACNSYYRSSEGWLVDSIAEGATYNMMYRARELRELVSVLADAVVGFPFDLKVD